MFKKLVFQWLMLHTLAAGSFKDKVNSAKKM